MEFDTAKKKRKSAETKTSREGSAASRDTRPVEETPSGMPLFLKPQAAGPAPAEQGSLPLYLGGSATPAGPMPPYLNGSSAPSGQAEARARDTSPWERLRASAGETVAAGTSLGTVTTPVDVRVHTDAAAGAVARDWQAEAFTLGRDLYFAPGALRTDTPAGRGLIAHELAHATSGSPRPADGAPFAPMHSAPERHASAVAAGLAGLGEAPASGPAVFRHPVNPTPVARRDRLALLGDGTPANPGSTLGDFQAYIGQQADWFTDPSLSAADRTLLWKLVFLLQENQGIGAGLGQLHLAELGAVPAADMPALRAYAAGADIDPQTVRITSPHSSLARVIQLGRAMIELATFVPAPVMRVVIRQADFETLVDESLIPTFRQYYADFQPTIENPEEMAHILTLLREGLATYAPLRGWIRDLHVFDHDTRARLAANMGDTTGTKPLMLVLMSGLDWNGAFLQARNLHDAVFNPVNLTIVVEGPSSLGAAAALATTAADTYGQIPSPGGRRRIGQVVIAGHGQHTSVELATPGTGATSQGDQYVSYDGTPLDAAGQNLSTPPPNVVEAQNLIDTVLSRMDPASARVVFAGCLVGSHDVPVSTDVSDPTTAAANIRAAMRDSPNLADFVRGRMAAMGITGEVQAANASTTFSAFQVDATGRASLSLSWDPDIGGSKAAYVASGSEPEGALRAALETWADPAYGPAWTTTTMRARVKALGGVTHWYQSLTRAAFELALPPKPGEVQASSLIDLSHRTEAWLLAGWASTADAGRLSSSVRASEAPTVYGAMLASDMRSDPHLGVIVHQSWMVADATHQANFLSAIDSSGLTRTALDPLLSRGIVDSRLPSLLSVPLGGSPTRAQLKLALAIAVHDGAGMPAAVSTMLRAAAGGTRTSSFPAALGIPALLDGASELQVLRDIGLAPGVSAPSSSSAPVLDDANADLDRNGTNERFISLSPREATVEAFALNVRSRPNMGDNVIGWLKRGDTVRVMGETHGWSAIDFNGRMAFVYHTFIRP